MCGIAGVFDPAGATPSQELGHLATTMAATMEHRGPDDDGVWVDAAAGVALSFRRLAIVDLSSAGHQPMASPSGRYTIVFNGEIYNHRRLRSELPASVRLQGHSDTEVLLATMDERGVRDALRATNGMFAVAVFDRQTRQLHLARDRIGEKPLYYGWAGGHLVFGSELKALRAHPQLQRTVDRGALALYLRYTFVPAPHTIYQGLRKLLPGTTVTFVAGHTTPGDLPDPEPYWRLDEAVHAGATAPFAGSQDDAAAALHDLLLDAAGLRMVADVPVGAFLSGGVDSSLVVALMQAAQPAAKVRTFTVAMPDAAFDESEAAAAVAHHLGTEHTTVELSPDAALTVVPKLAQIYDEPFADPSGIPSYLVASAAREHMTVALTGDGGDEAFAGYNRYVLGSSAWRKLSRVPAPLRNGLRRGVLSVRPETADSVVGTLDPLLPRRLRVRNPGDKLQKLARLLDAAAAADPHGGGTQSADLLYQTLVSEWPDPESVALGATEPPTFAEAGFPDQPGVEPGLARSVASLGLVERMMFLDQRGVLPDGMLTKVDRATMATSLESRLPLLDHRVVEFAWSLPIGWNLHGGRGKQLLRTVLDRYVPRSLIDRPKMGFDPPIGEWLRGPLRGWAEDLLAPGRLAGEGWLHPDPIRQRWQEHQDRRRNWDYALWTILQFQAWLETA